MLATVSLVPLQSHLYPIHPLIFHHCETLLMFFLHLLRFLPTDLPLQPLEVKCLRLSCAVSIIVTKLFLDII